MSDVGPQRHHIHHAARNGVVSREALLAAGLSPKQIRSRVQAGSLHREYTGVFSLGRPAATPIEQATAAVLACGREALLHGLSTLALYGHGHWPTRHHVLAGSARRHPGITVHRTRRLHPGEITVHHDVPTTTLARALLDTARLLARHGRLTRTVNAALRTPHCTVGEIRRTLDGHPHHAGRALLAAEITHLERTASRPTRSPLEDDFVAFCDRHGLPRPLTNVPVAGHERDAYFPAHRLIVELDGWDFHNDREQFERDRDRNADALAEGIPVLQVTKPRLAETARREAARLHRILQRRGPRESARPTD